MKIKSTTAAVIFSAVTFLLGLIFAAPRAHAEGGYHASPGSTNRLQRATSVTGPWSNLATNTAPVSGLVEFHETNPPAGARFYRTVQP